MTDKSPESEQHAIDRVFTLFEAALRENIHNDSKRRTAAARWLEELSEKLLDEDWTV